MDEAGHHTTQLLLARIRAGDTDARATLVQRVEPLLRRFAHGRLPRLLRHEQDTADLVQLTWVQVLARLDQLEPRAPGDFFCYLRTVLLNALRDALRRHDRSPIAAGVEVHDDTRLAAADVAPADWLAYEQALASLDPPQRAAVLMRFEFGMSYVEIGAELGEAADTVRMRVSRALQRLALDAHATTS